MRERGSIPRVKPLQRWDSRRTLSSFHIRAKEGMVQPSAAIAPSISSRRGMSSSGRSARW